MSSSVNININAKDNASKEIADTGKRVSQSLKQVDDTAKALTASQNQLEETVKDTAKTIEAAENPLSEMERKQLANVEASNDLRVAQQNLKTAQKELTDAVDKHGSESKEATDALRKYNDAQKQVDATSKNLTSSTKNATMSFRDSITAISGVATSAINVYNIYDRLDDMTLQIDKANLTAKTSANSLEDAQRRQTTAADTLDAAQVALTATLAEYGAGSTEAEKAQTVLDKATIAYNATVADTELAQDRYNVAVADAEQKQSNFNDAIIQSAVQMAPTAITLCDNIGKVGESLSGLHDWGGKVWDKLSSFKDVDFSALTTKLGGVTTSLDAVTASATTAAVAVAAVALGAYVAYEQETARTQNEILSGGGLSGQGWSLFGQQMPSLNLKEYLQVPPFAEGGIVNGPTLALIGEAGPEAVVPLREFGSIEESNGGGGDVTVNATININGDADERIVQVMQRELKNVLVEATSANAPSTQKHIRFGSRFTP